MGRKFNIGDRVQLSSIAMSFYGSRGKRIPDDAVGKVMIGYDYENDEKCVVKFEDGELVVVRGAVLKYYVKPSIDDLVEIKGSISVDKEHFPNLTRGRIASNHHKMSDSYIVKIVLGGKHTYVLVPRKRLRVLEEKLDGDE